MKNVFFTVGLFCFTTPLLSQENDTKKQDSVSVARRAMAYTAAKFALVRPFNVEYTTIAPYTYTSKLENTAVPESKVTDFSQLKVSSTFNFIKKQKWMLGMTLAYNYTRTGTDLTLPAAGIDGLQKDYHYHYETLNLSYFSKLFGKTAVFTSSLVVDGSEQHFERVKGLISGTLILKANAKTKLMAGILVNIDPSSEVPVIPIFTFEHKFNSGFMIDMIVPKQMLLRKQMATNWRLSVGTELDRTNFYLYGVNPQKTSQKYEYRQLDLNNGIVYEQLLGEHLVLTARTGLKWMAISRIFEKGNTFNNAVFELTADPTFYFNVGLSFNPFLKKTKTK